MTRYIALTLMATTAAAADLNARTECEPNKPSGAREWWSYRIVDGRSCWYPGKTVKQKSELYWSRPRPMTPVLAEQPQAGMAPRPSTMPAVVFVEREGFDKRWNDLLVDMAEPFWRWRQPLSDQRLWRSEHD